MEQTKALNALEPFLALSKSATSPRAAADLVIRATSAPNTFLFAELLQTPAIQALADSPEFASHLKLLQIFSYGTYETYQADAGAGDLPALTEAQALKLRQLSLLTLAKDRKNLTYEALQRALALESPRQVEETVISAIYAGLLHGTLDPAGAKVDVSSVAPLRDLAPNSIPSLVAALHNWSDRCTETLADLDEQVRAIRTAAAVRQRESRAQEEKQKLLISEARDREAKLDSTSHGLSRRAFGKRTAVGGSSLDDETMDVDEPYRAEDEKKKRANKRKM